MAVCENVGKPARPYRPPVQRCRDGSGQWGVAPIKRKDPRPIASGDQPGARYRHHLYSAEDWCARGRSSGGFITVLQGSQHGLEGGRAVVVCHTDPTVKVRRVSGESLVVSDPALKVLRWRCWRWANAVLNVAGPCGTGFGFDVVSVHRWFQSVVKASTRLPGRTICPSHGRSVLD